MSDAETRHPDAGTDGEQPTVVVEDPEDFARTRQLRAIFDARDHYRDVRRDPAEHKPRAVNTPSDRAVVFQAVQTLIIEIEPLLKQHEDGKELWQNKTYESKSGAPLSNVPSYSDALEILREIDPQKLSQIADSEMPLGGPGNSDANEWQQNKVIAAATPYGSAKIDGLSEAATGVKWAFPVSSKMDKPHIVDTPTQRLSDEIYRDCCEFIQNIGLGVDIEEETTVTKIDDDLVEEVEQWRQQNL